MAITWITPSGSLGILNERESVNIELTATSDISNVTLSLHAGNLPRGLKLENNFITGAPTEVRIFTESKFVVRATDDQGIKDRTFVLSVDGSDVPEWITKEGFLKVGQGEAYFVLDNAYVDFQLQAEDRDVSAGDTLEYYLIPNSGQLPPGLSLSKTGRITGFTDPIFSLVYNDNPSGAFDSQSYDTSPLDISFQETTGYDSYFFDNQTFDFAETTRVPRRLSRIYTFGVAVTDGVNQIGQVFKIYVITEEFLQADNTLIQVDTNLFQADNTNTRTPFWVTDPYLGRYRANNYLTLYLDVYDPPTLSGTMSYFLQATNPGIYQHNETGEIIYDGRYELSGKYPSFEKTKITLGVTSFRDPDDWTVLVPETVSETPPGLIIDTITGELAGRVPYQDAVTKSYKFTVQAVLFPTTLINSNYVLVGDWSSTIAYSVNQAVRYNGFLYICVIDNQGKEPSDDSQYWSLGVSSVERTFTVDIIGEIESEIEWVTPSDRGIIKPNQPSRIYVEAKSLIYGGKVFYEFVSGSLPPGLEFISTGTVVGKIKQFADSSGPGLTRFLGESGNLNSLTTFDNGSTSFDQVFSFTVKARDYAGVAESLRTFTITVAAETNVTFANIYARAFQSKNKRLDWFNFITDSTIFPVDDLYRPGDTNFGIQNDLRVLMFAGIESKSAVEYVQAMSRNHYNKRLRFGEVKSAKAKDPVTQETIYEAIYVDIVDELEKNGKSISETIELSDSIESKVLVSYDAIKVDSDIPFVSDSDHQRIFPNSFKNMRRRLRAVGERDREFLPLWMRSIQDTAQYELGYTKALVLCYTLPGKSANMLARIRASGFDFKSIDYVIERYIIDIIDGEIQDKYFAFPQRGEKLP